ncbi:MAG: hypothetical protein JWN75_482 [Candidatus Saccharibacteria bacterium]|nr:hypothetical protein [Candidatus Saccharibacteria bacterium]
MSKRKNILPIHIPMFSVIVPVYNAEKYLSKCLASIVEQTYRNIEIIVVNDGSTDGSLEIMKDFARIDSRIIIIDQSNRGVSASRNKGLSLAEGKYVLFVDADDYFWSQKAIQIINHNMENISSTCLLMFNVHEEANNKSFSLLDKYYADKDYLNILATLVKNEKINSPFNKVYNNSIIKTHRIMFNHKVRIGEDLLFNIEYLKHCHSMQTISETLYFYRKSDDFSATRKYLENKYKDLMLVNNEMQSWFEPIDSNLIGVSKYIRLKNILSCLRDLYHSDCTYDEIRKKTIADEYRENDSVLPIRGAGMKVYLFSLLYTYANSSQLLLFSKILSRWSNIS